MAPFVNHRQPRTGFESDTGRSALSAGIGLYAPHLPFAVSAGIGSVGWKRDILDLAGL